MTHSAQCAMSAHRGGACMHKRSTITTDEAVYDGLYRSIGKRRISQFNEDRQ